MDWKNRIQELTARELSIAEIADYMGVTDNAVREVLSGRTKQPRANAALRLVELCIKHKVGETPKRRKAAA